MTGALRGFICLQCQLSAPEEHEAQLMASLDVDNLMEKDSVQVLPDTRGYLVGYLLQAELVEPCPVMTGAPRFLSLILVWGLRMACSFCTQSAHDMVIRCGTPCQVSGNEVLVAVCILTNTFITEQGVVAWMLFGFALPGVASDR